MRVSPTRHEIAVIDTGVSDYLTLQRAAERAGLEVILLSDQGIAGLAEQLQGQENIDAVHVFSHGSEGELYLGGEILDSQSLALHSSSLEAISGRLSVGADVLLYGCDVASDERGQYFISQLSTALGGVDIAASDDLTGDGGDWELESHFGAIESEVILSKEAQASFDGTLAIPVGVETFSSILSTVWGPLVTVAGGTSTVSTTYGPITIKGSEFIYPIYSLAQAEVNVFAGHFYVGGMLSAFNQFSSSFSATDGTNFGVTSLSYWQDKLGDQTITVEGKDEDGVTVARFTQGVTGATWTTLNLASPAASGGYSLDSFADVNEIVITSDSNHHIDNIAFTAVPTLSLSGSTLAFTEDVSGALQIDSAGTVNDADGDADWNGGTLEVQITANNEAADSISIVDTDGDGTAITVSGTNILANGTDIGDLNVSGGTVTNGTKLTITFDSDATNANVQEVLQSLVYNNTSDTPGTSSRTITVTATDAYGASAVDTRTVSVAGSNNSPTATGAPSSITVTEDVASNVDLSPVTFADPEGDALTVTLTAVAGTFAATSGGGVTVGGSGTGTLTLAGTAANINTFLDTATNIQYTTASNSNTATSFTVQANDSTVNPTLGTVTVNITPVNDVPVFSNLDGDSFTYTEGDGQTVIDQGTALALTDIDSADLDGGNLTVTITSGEDAAEDLLSLDTSGTVSLAGTNAGDDVSVGGVVIGTLGNTLAAGNDLVINLNASATPARLETLAQALTYENSDNDNPTTGARNVRVTLNDGDTGTTANQDITITVAAENDAPVISNLAGDSQSNYRAGDGAVLIEQGSDVAVTDPDSADFNGGTLTVSVAIGAVTTEDVLSIKDTGSAAGEIGLSGNAVSYAGTQIGTFAGGSAGNPLVVTLNAQSDATSVAALISQITYENTATSLSTVTRSIEFVLTDGDTGTSSTSAATVNFYIAPPPTPTEPPTETSTEQVDGVEVTTTTTTVDGEEVSTVVVEPVSDDRDDTDSATQNADIPLHFTEGDSETVTTVSLPTGVGFTAHANDTAQDNNSVETLLALIDESAGDQEEDDMLDGGRVFLEVLEIDEANLWVNKVTLTTNGNTPPDSPITIQGSDNSSRTEALVIDASDLPSGTILNLQNIEFAVIVGPASIFGGDGQNTLYAGAGSQFIILGPDDDELHGGAGNDTVGSEGGDDLIFGDSGNDTLFGGEGKDQLHGGLDTDTVTYSGNRDDYIVEQAHGVITVTNKSDDTDVDTLINIEKISFNDQGIEVSYDSDLMALATMYQQLLGRQADVDGFQWWANDFDNGYSKGNTAINILRSDEATAYQGFVFHAQSAEDQIEALYTQILGRESDASGKAYWISEYENGSTIDYIAGGFMESAEFQQSYLAADEWSFIV